MKSRGMFKYMDYGRSRFFQKQSVVMDMNGLNLGRFVDRDPTGIGPFSNFTLRTGLYSGRIDLNSVPNSCISQPIESLSQFPEGLIVIYPYEKESIGYHLFHRLGMVQVVELQTEMDNIQMDLEASISTDRLNSPDKVMDFVKGMMERINQFRQPTSAMIPDIRIPMQPPPRKVEFGAVPHNE